MLSYVVPLVIIQLITLLTDLYTLYHIKYNKYSSEQFSTHHSEYYSLKDICKVCHTHCNDKSIIVKQIEIPLKSSPISCIPLFSLICGSILYYNSYLSNNVSIFVVTLFFTTLNIPMIVCLSKRNNFTNIAAARQRNNILAWNQTRKQQWEMKCALEDRIQNIL